MSGKIQQLQEALDSSQNIVFFGGAGVSTDSGIPDFRSSSGLFMQETGTQYRPEEIVSHSFFTKYPAIFFNFYFENMVYPEAQPGISHEFPVQLENNGKNVAVVTQNIDGLHQKAGSSTVFELHGTVLENYCLECGTQYRYDELALDSDGIPRCHKDNAIVRPNVVLYEEGLDSEQIQGAVDAISQADTLIVAGTSLAVYPAAGLINYFAGDHLFVINKTAIRTGAREAVVFEDSIAHVLDQINIG